MANSWANLDPNKNRSIAKHIFGHEQDGSVCGMCGSDKVNREDFRDDLSRKEFEISLMCQDCQDRVFSRD